QKSRKILDRSQKLFEGSGQKCETIILASENITNEILDYAESEKFDYIIIGTRGIGGLKRMFLGSIADKVIRHAHCPVIVIR
ncbi:MAG: universal stress protein, partial [Thermodesulfobacteriota bacterium]|nr:universal stress protein [Thermodesulfobacteriota bacterium]